MNGCVAEFTRLDQEGRSGLDERLAVTPLSSVEHH